MGDKKKDVRGKVFEITQQKEYLSEETIKQALQFKTIKKWEYLLHDKDIDPNGNKVKDHWHIVIYCPNKQYLSVIAKWFGVLEHRVKRYAEGAFLERLMYGLHETIEAVAEHKYHYDDSEVKANFDFRAEINERIDKMNKYGKELSERDEIRHKVLYEGLSISELCSTMEGQLAYQNDYAALDKLRIKYIQEYALMPQVRINYYVCGKGGDGKNLMCKALARALCPEIPPEREEDIFFEVGAGNVTFDGYDGQPVVIWNDFRAMELLKVLGGRGNVFKVFDTFPSGRGRQNIKYGSITLINRINIVNSVQDYTEFLDGLAGDYTKQDGTTVELAEDKGQSYRRFPFIIPLHETDFDLLMNKGIFDGTREYEQYIQFQNIRGSMKHIATLLNNDPEKRRELENKTVAPIVEKHKMLSDKLTGKSMTDTEIEVEFAGYGKQAEVNEEKMNDNDVDLGDLSDFEDVTDCAEDGGIPF